MMAATEASTDAYWNPIHLDSTYHFDEFSMDLIDDFLTSYTEEQHSQRSDLALPSADVSDITPDCTD